MFYINYKCLPIRSTRKDTHQQCDVNYREILRATVWSYEFHRRIEGRVPPAEGTRPCEKLAIPTDLAIVHITLLVVGEAGWGGRLTDGGRGGANTVEDWCSGIC